MPEKHSYVGGGGGKKQKLSGSSVREAMRGSRGGKLGKKPVWKMKSKGQLFKEGFLDNLEAVGKPLRGSGSSLSDIARGALTTSSGLAIPRAVKRYLVRGAGKAGKK